MKFLYVRVIEAKEVISRPGFQVPVPEVVLKMNSSDIDKKSTGFKTGTTWWEKTYQFNIRNVSRDFVGIELREKGFHVLRSDWLGELQIHAKDFDDGKVHQRWFRLGKAVWKRHRHAPKGCLHLKFQVLDKITDKPFTTRPVERVMTYEEWIDWQENQYAKKMFDPSNMRDYPLYDESDSSNKDHWRASSKRSMMISPLSSMSSLEDSSHDSARGDEAGAENKAVQSPTTKDRKTSSTNGKTSSTTTTAAGGKKKRHHNHRSSKAPKEGLLIDLSDAVPPPDAHMMNTNSNSSNDNNSSSLTTSNSNNPFTSEGDAGRVLDQLKRLSLSSSSNATLTSSSSSSANDYNAVNNILAQYNQAAYYPYAGACSVQASAANLNSSSKGNPFLEDGEVLPASGSGRFV